MWVTGPSMTKNSSCSTYTTAFSFDENPGYGATNHVVGSVPEPQALGLLLAAFGAAAWETRAHRSSRSSLIGLGLRP